MLGVNDPGIVMKFSPSPALIPARASVPPSPSSPPEKSPVVHCILPSAYRNTTNDSTPLVASIHWKVLVYSKIIKMYACKMNELRHMSLGKHLFSSIKKHPIKCSSPPMVNLKVTVFHCLKCLSLLQWYIPSIWNS